MLVGLHRSRYAARRETFGTLRSVMIGALTKPHLVLAVLMDYAPKRERF